MKTMGADVFWILLNRRNRGENAVFRVIFFDFFDFFAFFARNSRFFGGFLGQNSRVNNSGIRPKVGWSEG